MDGEEVEEMVRKQERFTAEKLLFVVTVAIFVIGFVLMYYGMRLGDVEKETEKIVLLSNEIKTSLAELHKNVDEINMIVNRSGPP